MYENVQEIRGLHRVAVSSRDGKIIWILVEREKLSKTDLVHLYGSNYRITRYDYDDCIDDTDAVPIFESTKGKLELFEYHELGIFFSLKNRGLIELVTFMSEALGATTSRCKSPS